MQFLMYHVTCTVYAVRLKEVEKLEGTFLVAAGHSP